MKSKHWFRYLVIGMALLLPAASVMAAQESEGLQLRLVRNFGYGGFSSIQGRFTLKAQGPTENLVEIQFYIDGELIGTDREAPFEVKFHTSEFEDGQRVMTAVGILADGGKIQSNSISKDFLSSEQAWSETEGILVPLLVGVGALTILGVGLPLLTMNKKDFVLGKYGPAGGTVCPRCSLPFSRSILSPNLAVGKLVRCPHCGKTSILPRFSGAALKEAEERYLQKDGTSRVRPGGDLIKQIEDSRFED